MTPGGILQPTDDMDSSVRFLAEVAGLKIKFRDGERYCAFEYGPTTLALVGAEEKIIDKPAMVYKVDDLAAAIIVWTARGATVLRPAERGPHEERAVLSLPGGGLAVLSAKIK